MKSGTKHLKPVVPQALDHGQVLQHWLAIYEQQLGIWHQLSLLHLIKKKIEISPMYIVAITVTRICSEH